MSDVHKEIEIRLAAQRQLRLPHYDVKVTQHDGAWTLTDLATGRRWRVIDGQGWPADHGYWFEEE